MFGVINIVVGILCFIPSQGSINWPGALVCLAVGIPATVASSMYNPCVCCTECGTGSLHLKTIAMLSIVAAVAAFAGTINTAVLMGNIASWPAPKRYVCCPANAMELTKGVKDSCLTESNKYGEKDCSSPNGKKGHDCIAGGPWPPMTTKEEPMTCFNGKVAVETKAQKGEINFFKGAQTYLLVYMGIGLAICALSLFATVLPAYFTWKEAMQSQNMEQAGGPA